MVPFIENSELLASIKAGGLGMVIGGIFAILGYTPPSPDNLTGIMGIVGIYLGWVMVVHFIK